MGWVSIQTTIEIRKILLHDRIKNTNSNEYENIVCKQRMYDCKTGSQRDYAQNTKNMEKMVRRRKEKLNGQI